MKKNTIFKIFGYALIALCAIVLIDLLTTIGDASSVLKTYDSVKPSSTSGTSKKLQFLKEYTSTSGDITLAVALGVDEGTANKWASGDTGDPSDTGGYVPGNRPADGDWQEKLNTLIATSSTPDYFSKACFVTNGYFWEKQSTSLNSVSAGSAGNYYGKGGCPTYAACMARTYLTGQIFTTLDYIAWKKGTSDYVNLSTVPIEGTITTTTSVVISIADCNALGMNVRAVSESDLGDMSSGVVYCVYGYSNISERKGNHWRLIVAYDDSPGVTAPYFILPNCNEPNGKWISKRDLVDLYGCGGEATSNNGGRAPSPGRVMNEYTLK